jgi:hypothetical protein
MFKRTLLTLSFCFGLSLVLTGCGTDNPFDRGADLPAGNQPDTPATSVSFASDVKPILQACASCHSGGAGGWVYTGGVESHASVMTQVNASSPELSEILIKATGGNGHGGGSFFNASSSSYQTIVHWITQGAKNN